MSNRYSVLALVLVGALMALSAAYIAQYGLGFAPCEWCLYQRVPYILIAVFAVLGFFLRRRLALYTMWFCVALVVVEIGLAFAHVGIEQHWWSFEAGCGGAGMEMSVEAELARLRQTPVIPCDRPQFLFLGFSMAVWNGIYAIFLLLFSILLWRKGVK